MAPAHRYDLIKDSDDGKEEIQSPSPPASTPWWKYAFYLLLAFSFGFGAAFGVVLATSVLKPSDSTTASTNVTATTTASPALATTAVDDEENKVVVPGDESKLDGKVLECGYSWEEARARGCVYDVMMQDWVPEPCYDPILTERYLAEGNYTWYSDLDGTVMSDEEMRKGEHKEAWMTGDYHKAHCIFSWEKLIRAMRNDNGISQELLSYDHVLHCRHQTLGGMHKRDGGIGVRAPTNYAKCARYDTWKVDFIPDKHSSIDK